MVWEAEKKREVNGGVLETRPHFDFESVGFTSGINKKLDFS